MTEEDRWCQANKVEPNVSCLNQLILLEDFKDSFSLNIKMHMEDLKIDHLLKVAVVADAYELTHHSEFSHEQSNTSKWLTRDLVANNPVASGGHSLSWPCMFFWWPCKNFSVGNNILSKPLVLVSISFKIPSVYQSFISKDTISFVSYTKECPVVILRDSMAVLSLVVADVPLLCLLPALSRRLLVRVRGWWISMTKG